MPQKVLVDSNFLFLPLHYKIDAFSEVERILNSRVEFIILKPILGEVEKIASKTKKLKKQAVFANKLSERCVKKDFEKHENETLDDLIVRVAKEMGCIVATCDMGLKRKLRESGVPVVYPRKGNYLVLEGYAG